MSPTEPDDALEVGMLPLPNDTHDAVADLDPVEMCGLESLDSMGPNPLLWAGLPFQDCLCHHYQHKFKPYG